MFQRSIFCGVALAASVLAQSPGAVYTMTNAAGPNSVVVYARAADGSLGQPGMLALGQDGRWLLAVNAGSNDVSVFSISGGGLTLRGRQPSGGAMPISVTIHDDLVFVLNAGGSANITGFRLNEAGMLTPIPGAQRTLAGSGPAQVSFNPDGSLLVITQKTSNTIETYEVEDGHLEGPFVTPSAGQEPFGFAFGHRNVLIVSEAFAGTPNKSAASSYQADDEGRLQVISASVGTLQTAACWVAVTNNGKYAYAANAGSSSVSSFAVGRHGDLTLLAPAAGMTPAGTSPIDLALSGNSQFLYSLASGTITGFRVAADGSLTAVASASGLPGSTVGLAAR